MSSTPANPESPLMLINGTVAIIEESDPNHMDCFGHILCENVHGCPLDMNAECHRREREPIDGAVVILREQGEIYEELCVCFGWNTDSEQCRSCDNFEACRASSEKAVIIIEETP